MLHKCINTVASVIRLCFMVGWIGNTDADIKTIFSLKKRYRDL